MLWRDLETRMDDMRTTTIEWLPLPGGQVAVFPLERAPADSPSHPPFRCANLGLALAAWVLVALPVWCIVG
jgi:hypothetical protein